MRTARQQQHRTTECRRDDETLAEQKARWVMASCDVTHAVILIGRGTPPSAGGGGVAGRATGGDDDVRRCHA